MNVNFSIPVTLFDYKQSENPLYSFAKLKIFYVGMTGDKRLFTKEFSDKLLETLPYVPVVGYYDEESEDFLGHNQKVQHIYGVVPEDTGVEYVKEDGKEYAVCDVILYTGRPDESGEIAQKIVGKSHSLELDPKNTKYKIQKDEKGKFKHIEFTEGRLFGLSVLGKKERPAFSGSEFFNENLQITQAFEIFKQTLNEFVNKEKSRGEKMDHEQFVETVEAETIVETETNTQTEDPIQATGEEFEQSTEVEEVGTTTSTTTTEETEETSVKDGFTVSEQEKTFISFMRTTTDEIMQTVNEQLRDTFGEVYIIQWSITENVIVFMDFNDYHYYRVNYTMDEETETPTFGEKVHVKMRFLTEEEINTIFSSSEDLGTEERDESLNNNLQDGGVSEQELQQEEFEEEEGQESGTPTFSESEREELIALREEVAEYRRARKLELIESFKEDLSSDFISKLEKDIDKYEFDSLEIVLSKEFTKAMKPEKTQKNNFTPLVYGEHSTTSTKSREQRIKELVEKNK